MAASGAQSVEVLALACDDAACNFAPRRLFRRAVGDEDVHGFPESQRAAEAYTRRCTLRLRVLLTCWRLGTRYVRLCVLAKNTYQMYTPLRVHLCGSHGVGGVWEPADARSNPL